MSHPTDREPALPTIASLLDKSSCYLREKGSLSPRLDAELLLAEVLGYNRIDLYLHFEQPLTTAEVDRYRELVRRRSRHEPVAYILGRAYFRNLTLQVTRDTLVPRPETEFVVEAALRLLQGREWREPPTVLDVGTGSGAIAIALASEFPAARVTAGDASVAALAIARENARTAGASERLELVESDLFAALAGQSFDLIVSNPPYISAAEWSELPADVREFEPRDALWAGEDGLDFYRQLTAQAPAHLPPEGALILEIGWLQGREVEELLRSAGFQQVEIQRDYGDRDRVVIGSSLKV